MINEQRDTNEKRKKERERTSSWIFFRKAISSCSVSMRLSRSRRARVAASTSCSGLVNQQKTSRANVHEVKTFRDLVKTERRVLKIILDFFKIWSNPTNPRTLKVILSSYSTNKYSMTAVFVYNI